MLSAHAPHTAREFQMNLTPGISRTASALAHTTKLMLGWQFDMARANYARAVRLGFIEHSLLRSARFERELAEVERHSLGLWARRV